MKLLQDRRLEVALKGLGKMGDDLGRLTELLEELSGQVRIVCTAFGVQPGLLFFVFPLWIDVTFSGLRCTMCYSYDACRVLLCIFSFFIHVLVFFFPP